MSKKVLPFVLGFIIIFGIPSLSLATDMVRVPECPATRVVKYSGLVPVCNTTIDSEGNPCDPCDFNMVMSIINKVITYLLVVLATPLFALIIIYTGWLYLSAGGDPGKVTQAKTIIKNAFIGYVIALAAWLIVKAILSTLGFVGPMFLG